MLRFLTLRLLPMLVLVLMVSMISWSLQAQDAQSTEEADSAPTEAPTEETPTEAPTEAPSEEPATEAPTEVPTDVPTEAPTEVPTDETTEQPTAQPSEEPTDGGTQETSVPTEPSEEPTDATTEPSEEPLPPEPPLRLFAAETFDSGDLSQWRLGDVWSLVESQNGQALSLNAEAGLIQFRPYPVLEDVAVTVRVQTGEGTVYIILRQDSDENYSMSLSPDGHVILSRSGQVLEEGNVAPSDDWRFVRFSVVDGILRATIGEQTIAVRDDNALSPGAVSLGGTLPTEDGQVTSSLLLDDIIIEIGEDEDPQTPEPTEPPVTEAPIETETPIVTEAPLPTDAATTEVTEEATQEIPTPTPTNITDGRVIVTPEVIIEPTRRVPTAPLSAPDLTSPANNAYINDSTPTLQWDADAGTILNYQIHISTSNTFPAAGRVTINSATDASTTVDVLSPLSDGLKYWRVRARFTDNSFGGWSTVRSFTVDTVAPARPVRIGPTCNGSTTDTTPTFSWNAATGAFRYEVLLDTVTPPIHVAANIAGTSYTPSAPLLYRTYYWRLRAKDRAGNYSPWTVICSLNVNSASNAAPVLNRNTTAQVPLTWTPISWATAYHVQVARNTTFTLRVYNNSSITAGTQTATTDALIDGTYYWRVRAKRADGTWGGWSSTGTFTVETTP